MKLPYGAVFTLDDEMRWSSDCPDTAEILNHQIDIGLAARGWGMIHVPDIRYAEAKRVAKMFEGEIIELKLMECPE